MQHQNNNQTCVLALDVGTSSARAVLFTLDAEAIPGCRTSFSYTPSHTEIGEATFDTDFLLSAIENCIDEVLKVARVQCISIVAVGVTSFWHSMVGVDALGGAITPVYTWADTRSAKFAIQLQESQNFGDAHSRTGCVIHSSYFPARLRWLQETNPDQVSRVSRWLSPMEYAYRRWFGREACSISMASATGLFNQTGCEWDWSIVDNLPIERDQLPPLVDLDESFTSLLPVWSDRWPELAHIPWAPVIGDGAASNVGSGCTEANKIAVNLGTSGAIRVMFGAGEAIIPNDLWSYRLDRKRRLMGAAFSDGGDTTMWIRDQIAINDIQQSLKEIAARSADSHRLTWLPFLAGERSMGWRPSATASVHGMTLTTTGTDILQAGMEAVALRFAVAHKAILTQFSGCNRVLASGGAFGAAPIWAQMLADSLGQTVELSEESEASSRGAAIVAMHSAGIRSLDDEPLPFATQLIEPKQENHVILKRALGRQQSLYAHIVQFENENEV